MAELAILPIMEIVTLDKLGRVLLPKAMRDALHLSPGARLLAVSTKGGKLVLQELDIERLARQADEEANDPEVQRVVKEIRAEMAHETRQYIEDVLAGRQRSRGRHQAPAPKDSNVRSRRRSR